MKHIRLALCAILLAGCAGQGRVEPELLTLDEGKLPAPNVTLRIPGLGPCTDNPDRSLRLDSKQPVTLLVHGCFGSAGRFRGLAQVLAFHGQQTACFSYDDRESLMRVSGRLAAALGQLAEETESKRITVIGHSQGGLIARKALVVERPDPVRASLLEARLVTVSAPFSGIAAANHCGNSVMRTVSLGLVALICRAVTGEKWSDITFTSEFIVHPGSLQPAVREHLKIDTEERLTAEFVFTIAEQRNTTIDSDPRTRLVELAAGHVEIVGNERVVPRKLIDTLQKNGIVNPTEPQRQAALGALLRKLYGP